VLFSIGTQDRWMWLFQLEAMQDAEAAVAAAETDEACVRMFALIDMDDVLLVHGVPATTLARPPGGDPIPQRVFAATRRRSGMPMLVPVHRSVIRRAA
jgi:hypothetical protein